MTTNTSTGYTTTTNRRISTETKASFKTTELIAYIVTVVGVGIASAVSDGNTEFGPEKAWFLITLLTIGYMISRGLAKAGSRDFYDVDDSHDTGRTTH